METQHINVKMNLIKKLDNILDELLLKSVVLTPSIHFSEAQSIERLLSGRLHESC